MEPGLNQIKRRTGQLPRQHLADSGYLHLPSIARAAAQGVELLGPRREQRGYAGPDQVRPRDSAAIAALRQRMGPAQGPQIYQTRAATAETVNADRRTRGGLDRLLLRGSATVLIAALWPALTYNLLHAINRGWLSS